MRFPFVASLALVAIASSAAAAPTASFRVGSLTFTGTPKEVCVLEGKWSDGEQFRYEAWDACSKMQIRRVSRASVQGVVELGANKKQTAAADIPGSAELFEVSNAFSRVLLFRDRNGVMRDILTGD